MNEPFRTDDEMEEELDTEEMPAQNAAEHGLAEKEQRFAVSTDHVGQRLDQFLAAHLPDISRARVQQLIEQGRVQVAGEQRQEQISKASTRLRAGQMLIVIGEATVPPLRATPEDIPLDIVYEDAFLAVINKPAGMMVHAGSGATEHARNRGTLVNALLHHLAVLSSQGGPLRPGIVHRLDKQTSGLILVAKDDLTHRRLGEMFAHREVHKIYIALVHGALKQERGTLTAPIRRDPERRTRMTTRGSGGRTAVTHYEVQQRFDTRYGPFTLLRVRIETGRTHQIRVHLSSIGYPVVGDTLYGAPACIPLILSASATRRQKEAAADEAIHLDRNFLHAARLEFQHPRTGKPTALEAPLPAELNAWLQRLTQENAESFVQTALVKSKK